MRMQKEKNSFMEYPKKIMTTSQLVKMGYPREFLYQIAHARNAPVIRGKGRNSQILFITDKLDEFIVKLNAGTN